MIRFIDLRGQGIDMSFAFWNTDTETFEEHGGEQAWLTFRDYCEVFEGDDIERRRRLLPLSIIEPAMAELPRPSLGSMIVAVLRHYGPQTVREIQWLLNHEGLWGGWTNEVSSALQVLRKANIVERNEHGKWVIK